MAPASGWFITIDGIRFTAMKVSRPRRREAGARHLSVRLLPHSIINKY